MRPRLGEGGALGLPQCRQLPGGAARPPGLPMPVGSTLGFLRWWVGLGASRLPVEFGAAGEPLDRGTPPPREPLPLAAGPFAVGGVRSCCLSSPSPGWIQPLWDGQGCPGLPFAFLGLGSWC